MAALSASRLVCSATALITSMTLPILSLSRCSTLMASVERTTSLARRSIWAMASLTTLSPSRASPSAAAAACEASSALRATSCTVAVISCMAVAT
ncbi:hypothetical protein D3C78_1220450 [compost metagenome]